MRDQFIAAVADMEEEEAIRLVRAMLDAGADPQDILDATKEALLLVGARYEARTYFLPELIIAGDLMKEVAALVKPRLVERAGGGATRGKVVIGTVEGDIHDIGKDIVHFMLDVNGFEVHDLGVDVPVAAFIEKVREVKPGIVALSGFLTLSYDAMRDTITALSEAGLRDSVKVMIGGGTVDEQVRLFSGADAFGSDAMAAVNLARTWAGVGE